MQEQNTILMKPKTLSFLVIFLLILLISACANPEAIESCVEVSNQKGFLFGLLHGFLAPVTFLISLFSEDVAMYAVNNNGGWYDFGFLLGIGGFSGGIFKSSSKKKK